MTTPLDIWDADLAPAPAHQRGVYIAISGNTAAGKSSLIATLETRMTALGLSAIGVSERVFHHQYLRLMFSQPGEFAFPIQLTFMLERHLVLLRNLVALRRTVIMERSHFDDVLFVVEHLRAGNITPQQRDAYQDLAAVLHARIPMPDVLVLLNPTPETSLERLARAENHGDRPKEFPSEDAKERWVRRWHAMYVDLHDEYRRKAATDPSWSKTTVIELDATQDRHRNAGSILEALRNRTE